MPGLFRVDTGLTRLDWPIILPQCCESNVARLPVGHVVGDQSNLLLPSMNERDAME
jgi:hypothetical protein